MATMVIVHGAWSGGWSWRRIALGLRQHGIEAFTPTLTGVGERRHLAHADIDLSLHIQDVVAVFEHEDLRDVILFGHSYGGMVITGVADRVPERISRLVYLDAFVPADGESAFDLLPPEAVARMRALAESEGDGWRIPPNPPPPDTAPADLAWINPRRGDQPIQTFAQKLRLEHPEPCHPRSYIYCRRTGPDDRFGRFAREARCNPAWQQYDIDASHAPNITAPEALTKLLVDIVAAPPAGA